MDCSTPDRRATPWGRVLIVDDHPDAADTLALLLESEGFVCRTAYSAEQALALMQQELPDVVVIDLFMPRVSGDQLAQNARQSFGRRCPRLVAYTAMLHPMDDDRHLTEAFDCHLLKPATTADLLEAIGGLDLREPPALKLAARSAAVAAPGRQG